MRERIPDPNAPSTFESAVLDPADLDDDSARRWHERYRTLLGIRHREIVPRLAGMRGKAGRRERLDDRTLRVDWTLGDGARLTLLARLGDGRGPTIERPRGKRLWPTSGQGGENGGRSANESLTPTAWSAHVFLDASTRR